MTEEKKWPISVNLIMPALLIFMINPTAALIFSGFSVGALTYTQDNKAKYYLFFLILACWLGFVNMTKVPEGDQPSYLGMFVRVPQNGFYKTVFEAWDGSGKEALYSFFTWLGYYICLGNSALFFFLITVIIYMFHFMAVYKVFEKI